MSIHSSAADLPPANPNRPPHEMPFTVIEAFKAGAEWQAHCLYPKLLDADARHYAMTGAIRHHKLKHEMD